MPGPETLLILGGTAEARALADAAVEAFADRLKVVTSLAGRVDPASPVPGELRVGGFGGAAGLAAYLRAEDIGLVVDATHPFAAIISANAHAACNGTGVPRLTLLRPPWTPPPGLEWIEVGSLEAAAALLPGTGRRPFLTVGSGGAEAFANMPGLWFLVRLMAPPEAALPLADYAVTIGRPPFTVENERRLIGEHQIDLLVTKQSGGKATEAKIIAAKEAGIPVIAVRRPDPEPGDVVITVEEALAWLERRV
ncbi:MAG: cobalt-precorrin-6A reductase [Rhodospirillales bacterium]